MTSSKPPIKININTIGDVMAHNPQLKAQYDSKSNTCSFENNFMHVKNYIEKADLSIANLETTLAGSSVPYSSYPSFNSPDALADALKYAGVDIISTINNHSFDKGDLGLERTLSVLDEKGFDTVGTIKNTTDKSKDKMNVFDMYNAELAFDTINATLNNIKGVGLRIVIIHWGNEYQRVPSDFQKNLAQMLSNSGIDIIIGSHPHVVQPVEMIKSSNDSNETLVIYSLGNFISNQRKELLGSPYTEDGMMVDIEIAKNPLEGETKITKATCIPTWVNKYLNSGKYVYEIIPITSKEELSNIENLSLDNSKISYDNTALQVKECKIVKLTPNPFEE